MITGVIKNKADKIRDDIAEQILADLIKEGLSGEKLLVAFKACQKEIRVAAGAMRAKAEDIAAGKAEFADYEDVFGTEE